ncbi:DUF1998 domain-containing protein [Nocardia wallacei]|uniref:DUF1998 domain-containing protein n=1 Tax=Nocardia wallacei TaxID=480035 RepID=UPI0024585C5E|nr:DUF1998 domain-containing protein [Nocardia wallacei]
MTVPPSLSEAPVPQPIHDPSQVVDPIGDTLAAKEDGTLKNHAKIGSARPSSLLYTYGPGSVMDLPNFTIMPAGLDAWNKVWRRRGGIPVIHAPRLRAAVRKLIPGAHRDIELRPHPWQAEQNRFSNDGVDLGVPARVFPQWMRCTGCDMLAPLGMFRYVNTNPYRTDHARFEHVKCHGRRGEHARGPRPAVPARYLLACPDGHVDEFPYEKWVHRGLPCSEAPDNPRLKMTDRAAGKGAVATVRCESCGLKRGMNEAQGESAKEKLPSCRGRHPHLDAFYPCSNEVRLILVGASNLWFPASQSVIVMPEHTAARNDELASRIRAVLGAELSEWVTDFASSPKLARRGLAQAFKDEDLDVSQYSDDELQQLLELAATPVQEDEADVHHWDPIDLLVPEWQYLERDPLGGRHEDPLSNLTLSRRVCHPDLPAGISRVLAVESLRKVNALIGFTRIDAVDRVDDLPERLVPLSREDRTWTVATEDRGEGVFLQLDESAVDAWEQHIVADKLWKDLREAHSRNFNNRYSETAAKNVDPDDRMRPPRYWLVHTLAHVLIREMAMSCGYNAASLSERLYAWQGSADRPPAAGLLICTTASDSDGTLGGLVELSEPDRLHKVVTSALRRATRCSSDPICAGRIPQDPEDFLHGAACHCCTMASETSCERANQFLDRRFLIDLPGSQRGFFGRIG